jgi:endonuclease/exonuclease/phosphatase family metal-dependent hydrolase
VGIALILSVLAGHISISSSSIIQVFGLIYPILTIINLIFLFFWIFTKSKLLFFPILLILVGYGNVFNNFQITIFNQINKQPHQIKVLSYNVQNFKYNNNNSYLETKNNIVNFLINEKPDIVCLQEYHSVSNLFYKPLKDIRDSLGASTYYYESYFNRKNNQLSGLVIFSRYKVINKGKLKFHGSRTYCVYTDVIINMDTVRIFNTHLASTRLNPEDIDFVVKPEAEGSEALKNRSTQIYHKLAQAYQLREKQLYYLLNEIKSTPYNIILCGDFNDTPSSWIYKQLANNLQDTFVEKGIGISNTYAGPLPLLRIDYILTSDNIKTCGYKRYDIKKSDHYPISAIIEQIQ